MKIALKALIFLCGACSFYVQGGDESLEGEDPLSHLQTVELGNIPYAESAKGRTRSLFQTRREKIAQWRDSRSIGGDFFLGTKQERIDILLSELEQIKSLNSTEQKSELKKLLNSWTDYLNRVFFNQMPRLYTEKNAQILRLFMDQYMAKLFKKLENCKAFNDKAVATVRDRLIRNYYRYMIVPTVHSVNSLQKWLSDFINSRTHKINTWVEKNEQWRLTGRLFAPYKSLQKKYENEVNEYGNIFSKLVSEFKQFAYIESSVRKMFPQYADGALEEIKLLKILAERLFSPGDPMSIISAIKTLYDAWYNFIAKFTWNNNRIETESLRYFRVRYLYQMQQACTQLTTNISKLTNKNDAPKTHALLEEISAYIDELDYKVKGIKSLIDNRLTPAGSEGL
jgi:hypothetical protein